MDDCIEFLDSIVDDLTENQLTELDQAIKDYNDSPGKFMKYLWRKLKEFLEQS